MRSLYRFLIVLHPPGFRRRFEDEMVLNFDETVASRQSTTSLFGDALVSLFRRWLLRRPGQITGSFPLQAGTWWLLALCGFLDAIYTGTILFMQGPDGYWTLRTEVNSSSTLLLMGLLALAAGVVTLAAGFWSSRNHESWLVVLNGLACGAFGLTFFAESIGFSTFAYLISLMALSIGIYELATARTLRRRPMDKWFLGAAGVVSVGFALAFLSFICGFIKLEPRPLSDFVWVGSYFGFSAICMLGLSLRLHFSGSSEDGVQCP